MHGVHEGGDQTMAAWFVGEEEVEDMIEPAIDGILDGILVRMEKGTVLAIRGTITQQVS